MYLRLVVRHWDARLMDYASAFQKELMTKNWLSRISAEVQSQN